MTKTKIVKIFLLFVLMSVSILIISGYILYVNRAKIADKLLDYTMQGITGIYHDDKKEEGTWLTNLIGNGNESVKDAMIAAVVKRGLGYVSGDNNKEKNRQPGLASFADMLANGAGNDRVGIDKIAQAVVKSFQTETDNSQSVPAHDINSRDDKGRTLLMNICRGDVEPRVIRLLMKYGAEINAKDDRGRNALMYAAALNENPEIVQILLDYGADASAHDYNGKSVNEYAEKSSVKAVLNRYYYRH